jgi:hypothetical protein
MLRYLSVFQLGVLMKARISAGWEGRDAAVMVGCTLFGACLLIVMILRPTIAASQEAPSRDQSAIVGARYALWEINSSSYFEPVVRYDASFAGDPTRKNISNLQFAPTFNLGLPDQGFITFYPSADIRINLGDPITGQTGRLFLPFDARIGRKLSDNAALSFELGVCLLSRTTRYII